MLWNIEEKQAVIDLLDSHGPLKSAMQKLFEQKRTENEANSASCMRSLPRQIERASDFAAKAEAYASLMDEFEAETHR